MYDWKGIEFSFQCLINLEKKNLVIDKKINKLKLLLVKLFKTNISTWKAYNFSHLSSFPVILLFILKKFIFSFQ